MKLSQSVPFRVCLSIHPVWSLQSLRYTKTILLCPIMTWIIFPHWSTNPTTTLHRLHNRIPRRKRTRPTMTTLTFMTSAINPHGCTNVVETKTLCQQAFCMFVKNQKKFQWFTEPVPAMPLHHVSEKSHTSPADQWFLSTTTFQMRHTSNGNIALHSFNALKHSCA